LSIFINADISLWPSLISPMPSSATLSHIFIRPYLFSSLRFYYQCLREMNVTFNNKSSKFQLWNALKDIVNLSTKMHSFKDHTFLNVVCIFRWMQEEYHRKLTIQII
jgi:hypothetical protein